MLEAVSRYTCIIPVIKAGIEEDEQLFLNRLNSSISLKFTDPRFGVKQLARLVLSSPAQLNRKLEELTGYSTGRLLRYYRLAIAKQLLLGSEDDIKQIAWQCGFSEHTNFCRTFLTAFGCNPSQYRKNRIQAQPFCWDLPFSDHHFTVLLHLARHKLWLGQLLKTIFSDLTGESRTVEQLADIVCLSASSLNRKVKETFEITPQRMIRDLKLQYASELLASRPVYEVSNESGFFDHAHFCRCFKRAFGHSPSAFKAPENNKLSLSWLMKELMIQNDK